ncbi:MAG: Fic family protein [Luteitalea sp.]|nr:Fic family protein [Luteitalea sp.]
MPPETFTEHRWGTLLPVPPDRWAFVPHSLPPQLNLSWDFVGQIAAADRAAAELASITRRLPDPQLLVEPFLKREAVSSSRLAGLHASLSDLCVFETAGAPSTVRGLAADVREVARYVHVLEYGVRRAVASGITLRLLRELHGRLLKGLHNDGRGSAGEFRRAQAWIEPVAGTEESRFAASPPGVLPDVLKALERFLQAPSPLPPLVRAALIHYQFGAIHPFVRANGRLGRMLIALLLGREQVLPHPVLYLSATLECRHAEYERLLLTVSQRGEWDPWIRFFLELVVTTARDALRRADGLLTLRADYRARFTGARSPDSLLKLVDHLFAHPVVTIPGVAKLLDVTPRTARLTIRKLETTGLLEEATGRQRYQMFIGRRILEAMED